MRIAITGCTGYVGKEFLKYIHQFPFPSPLLLLRDNPSIDTHSLFSELGSHFDYALCDFTSITSIHQALRGCDVVVHLAGKAHIAESSRFELFQDFMEANHLLTFNIARASVLSSVKRIVLLSSASVYGLNSSSQFISESYPTIPTSSYGLSKLLAEYSLHDVLYKTDTDYVILRSPMVYGENSPGNFRRLSRLFNTFYILPFSAISAKRSFIFVGNLVDILLLSCTLAKLSNGIYNISDCYDISLRDICAAYLHSLPGIRPLLPIPKCILSFLAFLSGSYRDWQKMSSPLRFDVNSFIKASNWQPRFQPIDSMQKIF